jgi:hypothetical protein
MARQLERELSNRHIQLIAIGGAISTNELKRVLLSNNSPSALMKANNTIPIIR